MDNQAPQLPATLVTAILVALVTSTLDPTIGDRVPELLALAQPSPRLYQEVLGAAPWVPMEAITAAGLPHLAHQAAARFADRHCGAANVLGVASRVGRLDVLEWWVTQDVFQITVSPETIVQSIKARRLDVLEWWFAPGRMGPQEVQVMTGARALGMYSRAALAVAADRPAILEYLEARSLVATPRAMQLYAAAAGSTEWLTEYTNVIAEVNEILADINADAQEIAGVYSQVALPDNQMGDAALMAAFLDNNEAQHALTKALGRIACQFGHVNVLDWIVANVNGAFWGQFGCVKVAVSHGQMDALEWLRERMGVLFREEYDSAVAEVATSAQWFLNWCVRMGHNDLAIWHMRHILGNANAVRPLVTFQFLLLCVQNAAQDVLAHVVEAGLLPAVVRWLVEAETLVDVQVAVVRTRDGQFLEWWEGTIGEIGVGSSSRVLRECAKQGNLDLLGRGNVNVKALRSLVLAEASAHGQLHVLHWWTAQRFRVVWQPAAFEFERLLEPTVGHRVAWVMWWWKLHGGWTANSEQPKVKVDTLLNLARRGESTCLEVIRANDFLPATNLQSRKRVVKAAARAGQLGVLRWARERAEWLLEEWKGELLADAANHPRVRAWLQHEAFAPLNAA